MDNNEKFDYVYSAPTESERREIESIKKQYLPTQDKDNKLNKLRDLNKRVNRTPAIISYLMGTFGTLTFGLGMTLMLEWNAIVWGVIIGAIGAAIAAAAYPIYKVILNNRKRKYGNRIIELSNELLNEKEN